MVFFHLTGQAVRPSLVGLWGLMRLKPGHQRGVEGGVFLVSKGTMPMAAVNAYVGLTGVGRRADGWKDAGERLKDTLASLTSPFSIFNSCSSIFNPFVSFASFAQDKRMGTEE
jgi:hypothetical protein